MYILKSILLTGLLSLFMITTTNGLKVGDQAVDFNLKNVDGNNISLNSNSSAKGYILVFTCNTCPYSKLYEDRIIELHNMYSDKGYPVIAIQPNDPSKSPGDAYPLMQERAKEKGFPFPYLMDDTQETTKAYGATNTPHVYVLNKEGSNFSVKYIGAIDNNSRNADAASKHYVQDAVNSLIEGGEVSTTSTKAIGCTIKWAN